MADNIYNSSCLVKSYTSDSAMQYWIDDIKKRAFLYTKK